MNLDQIFELRNSLRETHVGLINELNSYGKKSWLVMTVDVYSHRPHRSENGCPLGVMVGHEYEPQDRFVIQSDGFTQVDFEIIGDRFKVLYNSCFNERFPEDIAFNHSIYAVGAEVDTDALRMSYRSYVQLSNARCPTR